MKIEQRHWTADDDWELTVDANVGKTANLVLVFGTREVILSQYDAIKDFYPDAIITFATTAGEIIDTFVYDDTITTTAINFEHTKLKSSTLNIKDVQDSLTAGKKLAESLPQEDLVHVFVLSDGHSVNGSDLVKGLSEILPKNISITGGLAGDGAKFEKTLVALNTIPAEGNIALVGFYGDRLKVGYGSMGGWDSFGPERIITRAEGNVLYELDNQSALKLYKEYLGAQADGLPSTGLLFPLSIWTEEGEEPLVRTILSVDEENQSMTFAGDVPTGFHARLMRANFDRLVAGASTAAEKIDASNPDLAILISCVGRKLVLAQRIEEEIEGVRDILGEDTVLTGFYSYGEISPFTATSEAMCKLHNQTMTITTFSEQ
ncbi:FIST N-terminal domain-containing protein [Candidatus Halobeggiatoa sp. HSG11]|nr:FIST N-terminal domain-containing protein [Candidatus Halobeggiatoa sp. HSG11]